MKTFILLLLFNTTIYSQSWGVPSMQNPKAVEAAEFIFTNSCDTSITVIITYEDYVVAEIPLKAGQSTSKLLAVGRSYFIQAQSPLGFRGESKYLTGTLTKSDSPKGVLFWIYSKQKQYINFACPLQL